MDESSEMMVKIRAIVDAVGIDVEPNTAIYLGKDWYDLWCRSITSYHGAFHIKDEEHDDDYFCPMFRGLPILRSREKFGIRVAVSAGREIKLVDMHSDVVYASADWDIINYGETDDEW